MPVRTVTGSVKKDGSKERLDYKKAECLGNYGNGRARKDFCGDVCEVSRKCWRQTVAKGITLYFPPSDVLAYNGFIAKWFRKYPENSVKARRLALKESIKKGLYDPYLQIVVMNTQRGIKDSPAAMQQFKGGVWYYHGAIVAYHA